jgi:hypothetical protein
MIIIGKQYANWKVINLSRRKEKKILYLCICNCGFKREVRDDQLKRQASKSCSSCKYQDKELKRGDKFGQWTVLKRVASEDKRSCYEVQCECGFIKQLKGIRLRFGDSTACRKCGSTKHGMVHSRTYTTWGSMIQRCTNPNQTKFKDYGGRGITVCDRWLKFENFLEDMGQKPSGLELDRTNNNGNYELENCRWVTRKENLNNTRINKKKI